MISEANVRDTGRYQCLYKKRMMQANNETATPLYVYIRSKGKKQFYFSVLILVKLYFISMSMVMSNVPNGNPIRSELDMNVAWNVFCV